MNPHEVQIQSCFVSVGASIGREVIVLPVSDSRPATPRPAATVILLRRSSRHRRVGLEVLMVERGPGQTFMPGVWVFPGGVIEAGEDAAECSRRELREETGIELRSEERRVGREGGSREGRGAQ